MEIRKRPYKITNNISFSIKTLGLKTNKEINHNAA
jgi:hypothetical protein